jgi:hypothetical protein
VREPEQERSGGEHLLTLHRDASADPARRPARLDDGAFQAPGRELTLAWFPQLLSTERELRVGMGVDTTGERAVERVVSAADAQRSEELSGLRGPRCRDDAHVGHDAPLEFPGSVDTGRLGGDSRRCRDPLSVLFVMVLERPSGSRRARGTSS